MLSEGDTAPDFVLPGTDGDEIGLFALADALEQGPVVIAFYRFDFHPACTDQVCAIRDLEWFEFMAGTRPVAISTDSAFSHRAFAREHDIDFPLLSDDTGTVSDTYGVLSGGVADHGLVSNRATFVVDTDWTVRYAWAADDLDDEPDLRPVKRTLESMA
jgi:peroxiredoxin